MNDLQRAARTRKLVYLGLIVGLFTLSMFVRGKFALGNPNVAEPGGMDRLAGWTVQGQAERLELSELEMGDPEVAGAAARVALVGLRGPVITYMWSSAIKKQMRGEWHDFELYARTVTRLQPNFIIPWLFQGWNITYNVSVENDKLGDMFFFIARGIELLSEGDRLNTKTVRRRGQTFLVGSPDLRKELGFFYQNKFTVSDKVTTLRCLMNLTAMKPEARSPARILKQNSTDVNVPAFRAFCQENPQLVRRLVTPRFDVTLKKSVAIATSPEEIADFLAVNAEVPTRWEKSGDRTKPDEAQFPTLPPNFAGTSEYFPNHPDLAAEWDKFDALVAARAWFQYAQRVVPPPPQYAAGVGLPAAAPRRPDDYDPSDPDAQYKYRMPSSPALIIFRYYPARAQSYLAERLQKEGWYDDATRWDPDAGRTGSKWFPEPTPLRALRHSQAEWLDARDRWTTYGRENGLNPSSELMKKMEDAYRKTLPYFPPGSLLPDELPPEFADKLTADDFKLRKAYTYLPQNLGITNYRFFQDSAKAEADPEMVAARKLLAAAEQAKGAADLSAAAQYADALAAWRVVLTKQPDYHYGDKSDPVHEFTFEQEQKLIDLLEEESAVVAQVNTALSGLQAVVPSVTVGTADPTAPPDPFGSVALSRKDLLRTVAEERAMTEIAVRQRMRVLDPTSVEPIPATLDAEATAKRKSQIAVTEAAARKDVAGDFAHLRWYTAADRKKPWVRDDIRNAKLEASGARRRPAAPPEAEQPAGPNVIPQPMPGPGK